MRKIIPDEFRIEFPAESYAVRSEVANDLLESRRCLVDGRNLETGDTTPASAEYDRPAAASDLSVRGVRRLKLFDSSDSIILYFRSTGNDD